MPTGSLIELVTGQRAQRTYARHDPFFPSVTEIVREEDYIQSITYTVGTRKVTAHIKRNRNGYITEIRTEYTPPGVTS